ncbi:hypothetical protein L208DRAFT_1322570, partial [Tricholoma matsutake]
YRTNIKNRRNTQGTPPRQPKPLAKGNPKLKLCYIIQGLGAHLAKGNPKRKL